MSDNIDTIPVNLINGQATSLAAYRGKVLLVVNVASACGLTPQYEGLEKLYEDKQAEGLVVLGFPANEFGAQEPGSDFRAKLAGYGITQEKPDDVLWNFEKFLISKDGRVVGRFAPDTTPDDAILRDAIERELRA